MNTNTEIILILHNIRSNQNVGSIFRTADAASVSKIFLSGYTPAPLDKFDRKNKAIAKAALGAEDFIEWESVKSLKALVQKLKTQNFKIIAVEQAKGSKSFDKFKYPKKIALILGNEVDGISKAELTLCDGVVEIPMKGKKESLNVAVSAGIVLFSIR